MGREIKRVALDFNWPLHAIWKGYINPYHAHECKACKGSGMNAATKQLSDDWYDFAETGRRWCDSITQDEVDALVAAGRLMDFTRRPINEEQVEQLKKQIEEGGSGYWLKEPNGYCPTAEEVNAWNKKNHGILGGHDSINHWICVRRRAERLGVYGECEVCAGKGYYWCDDKYEKLYEDWESIEPPEGEGWQLWETVSEGSPVSPVFSTAEDLARYLATTGDGSSINKGMTFEQWMKFIDAGWAPTMLGDETGMHSGVVAVARKE